MPTTATNPAIQGASTRGRLCVFCGASAGLRPEYAQAAQGMGRALADAGLGLVYGGTSIGLMGLVADAALAGGAEVVGVLPGTLVDKEIAHRGLTRLHVVDSLAERKQLMFDLADGFVALPGGTGTLDELTEMLTWAQLGFHSKLVGVLNVAGFFDPLLAFLQHAGEEGFIRERHLALLTIERDPDALLTALLGRMAAAAGRV